MTYWSWWCVQRCGLWAWWTKEKKRKKTLMCKSLIIAFSLSEKFTVRVPCYLTYRRGWGKNEPHFWNPWPYLVTSKTRRIYKYKMGSNFYSAVIQGAEALVVAFSLSQKVTVRVPCYLTYRRGWGKMSLIFEILDPTLSLLKQYKYTNTKWVL